MSTAPAASREYLKGAVLTASPEQLHLLLLDGAVRYAQRGLEALQGGDIAGTFNALERAQRIVVELSNGLRPEVNPALAERMVALYGFIFRRLVEASLHRNATALEEALRILRHQRETWVLLMDKLRQAGPAPPAGPADGSGPPAAAAFVAEA